MHIQTDIELVTVYFPGDKRGRAVKLTTHLHLHVMPILRMGGVIPLLTLNGFMAWRGKNFKLTARYQDLIYMYTVHRIEMRMALNYTSILKLLLKWIILFAMTNTTTGIYL